MTFTEFQNTLQPAGAAAGGGGPQLLSVAQSPGGGAPTAAVGPQIITSGGETVGGGFVPAQQLTPSGTGFVPVGTAPPATGATPPPAGPPPPPPSGPPPPAGTPPPGAPPPPPASGPAPSSWLPPLVPQADASIPGANASAILAALKKLPGGGGAELEALLNYYAGTSPGATPRAPGSWIDQGTGKADVFDPSDPQRLLTGNLWDVYSVSGNLDRGASWFYNTVLNRLTAQAADEERRLQSAEGVFRNVVDSLSSGKGASVVDLLGNAILRDPFPGSSDALRDRLVGLRREQGERGRQEIASRLSDSAAARGLRGGESSTARAVAQYLKQAETESAVAEIMQKFGEARESGYGKLSEIAPSLAGTEIQTRANPLTALANFLATRQNLSADSLTEYLNNLAMTAQGLDVANRNARIQRDWGLPFSLVSGLGDTAASFISALKN